MTDLVHLVLALRRPEHDRVALDQPAGADARPARHAVRHRGDLIVIDGRESIDHVRQAEDGRQERNREDRPLARLHHHGQRVGLAEVPVVAVVNRDEGVALRKQVAGVKLERQPHRGEPETDRHHHHRRHHPAGVPDQPSEQTLHS